MKTNGEGEGQFASMEWRKRRANGKECIGSIKCNGPMTNNNLVKQQQQQLLPSPSLIRRARFIRRRTTNVYCETLKQLKEQDAALISQILLIGLKPRSEASEFECSCSGSSSSSVIPSVEFACPSLSSNFLLFPPILFYPDFMKGTIQRREEREAFQVILTNEKGDRKFAFCFKFPRPQIHTGKRGSMLSADSGIDTLRSIAPFSVLVFVSHYPQEALFHGLAANFVEMLQNDKSKMTQMSLDLLRLRFTSRGGTKFANHWSRSNVSTVVEKVGVENAALIFLCLLSERRVIVTGANVRDVSTTVQTFVRLLAPLEWPHTLIPIVPDSQTELCFNPTPYICGILRYNLSKINELICPERFPKDELFNNDITLIDVDRGMIVPSISRCADRRIGLKAILQHSSSMGFPHSAVCEIVSALKSCLPVRDPEKADHKIEKKVMIWYAKLFGHYRKFGQNILSARNRKLFAHAHPCAETRHFLKWFVENGILQSFIFSQFRDDGITNTNPFINSCALLHRFHKILKKYAPPVDGNGNRRRTKSVIWRVFTR
ncbi:hypothetical protein niasHT_009991 [Heterodera trifolii]|uniref:UDENN domain-containing protein n=1 Tax=Heterodera trifolii TaxID=157864 RepID=A0ABD2M8Z0_9BILA